MKKPRLAEAQPGFPVRRRPSRGKPKEPKPGTPEMCLEFRQIANVRAIIQKGPRLNSKGDGDAKLK